MGGCLGGAGPQEAALLVLSAAGAGLRVWFSPFPVELGPPELLELFGECAEAAATARKRFGGG
jgi:hypothetical protein